MSAEYAPIEIIISVLRTMYVVAAERNKKQLAERARRHLHQIGMVR